MNKEKLFNYAISKLKNKKVSNAQKATVRQLIDAGVIDSRKFIELSQAGNHLGFALGAPGEHEESTASQVGCETHYDNEGNPYLLVKGWDSIVGFEGESPAKSEAYDGYIALSVACMFIGFCLGVLI